MFQEAHRLDPTEYWRRVPPCMASQLHFFNIPLSAEPDATDNPLTILQQVATPDDFVVIKLDIDHTALELKIIATILNTPAIRERVDEVYFEYHYWVEFNFGERDFIEQAVLHTVA